VTGGVNVDPAEVEDILRSHPGVQDVSVVGLPDPEWGEVVGAAAVRTPGIYPDPAELETLARSRLTSSKIPRRIVFVEDLPRNANGKVDREAVRASFAGVD
jgi:acyl-CoA synthetase (AMP-forming)/AMP-acid ligase II